MVSLNLSNCWSCFPHKPQIKTDTHARIKKWSQEKTILWNGSSRNLILQALKAPDFNRSSCHLKKICQALKPTQLHELLKASAKSATELPQLKGPSSFQKLTQLLTLEQIEQAIKSEYPSFETSMKTAKEMATDAKYYLEVLHPAKAQPLLNSTLHNLIWGIESAIDTTLSILGYDMLRRDMDSPMEAQYRLDAVLTMVSAVTACISLAIGITGSSLLGISLVAAGIALSTAALVLYFKYIKPAPRSIKGCQNFTAQAASGHIAPLRSRQEYIDQIAATLIASKEKPKVHPLLIGRSGVGKTEIMKGFAQCVAEGRYPELKGKQVFYINAADLIPQIGGGGIFDQPPTIEKIRDRIRHRREDVILIIDEAHQIVQGSKNGNLGEKLKTLLDDGEEGFPYMIAATTDEEYIKHILQGNENDEDNPLARRFKQIPIDEMNKDQTIAVLNKMILKQTGLQISTGVIEKAYDLSREQFPNRPQPYMACRILAQTISRVKDRRNSTLQKEVSKEESLLEKNRSSLLILPGLGLFSEDYRKEIQKQNRIIESRLELLQEKMAQEKNQADTLKAIINKLEETKEKLCLLAVQVDEQKGAKPSKKMEGLMKEFALTAYYMNWAWENLLEGYGQQNGQRYGLIDLSLVQQVVDDELKLNARKKTMLKTVNEKKAPKKEGSAIEDDNEMKQKRQLGKALLMRRLRRRKRL